jgi:chromosome partitioning protein
LDLFDGLNAQVQRIAELENKLKIQQRAAVNLSAGLLHVGKRVLLIDTDPQANATINLLPKGYEPEFTIKDVFYKKKLDQAICPSVVDGLDIVPSMISFAAVESELTSKIGRELILKKALNDKIKQKYDFIIIDTPPALGMISINTLCAADEVIIPIHEFYALEGVLQLMDVISQVREDLNPGLKVSAVLLTMYDERTNLAREMILFIIFWYPLISLAKCIT